MSSPDPSPKPQRKARRRVLVDVEPQQDYLKPRTLMDRLRKDFVTGGTGLLVSVALHGVVLLILGFIIFKVQTNSDGDSLSADWLTPGSGTAKRGRKIAPVELPFDLGPSTNTVQSNTASTNSGTTSSTAGGATAGPGAGVAGVGVAPVNAGGALGSRNSRMRGAGGGGGGGGGTGSPEADRAIKQGLQWLARQQQRDGHWELHDGYPDAGFSWLRSDTAATALALLPFLGHGDTHQSGEFTEVVSKGVQWLQKIQDPETGDFHDMRREEGREAAFYAHSMATIVICEALALTGDEQLRPAAERGARYLLMAQHPDKGGWKFRPISKVMDGDLSVTGWALMALHTARMAGIDIPHDDFVRASGFLDSVKVKGLPRYKFDVITPDDHASPAMTAEAVLCRQWFGWPKDYPEMVGAVRYITSDEYYPAWTEGRRNVYAWYYTSQVLHNLGGEDWKRWNKAVRDVLTRNQVTGGSAKKGTDTRGSWNPASPSGATREYAEKGGRLYITAMCLLILETPYRHQPIYPSDEVASKASGQ